MIKCKLWLLLFCVIPLLVTAQTEQWDVYLAQYDKGVGSVIVDMGVKDMAPVARLPFMIITGVKFDDCKADGMPSTNEFDHLYVVSDSVKLKINNLVENKLVGTFTYQCERLDYYYVKDTVGLRQVLSALYSTRFERYQPYISFREDKSWKGYLDFLYPNEVIFEYMKNQKVLIGLQESGDDFEKSRKVDHWLYFATEQGRECFIEYATKNKFIIETKEKTVTDLPFKLQISRTDKVTLPEISAITLELRKQVRKCKGKYDGWETFVVK